MDTETSEESPLLLNSNTHSRESNEPSGVRRLSYSPGGLITITLVIALIASAEAGSILQLVPLNQVLEKIICENAHQPASTCGENADVQAELALLRGWQSTFDLLPGILTAIFYGFLADKYGRKAILLLTILGIVLCQLFYLAVCWWPERLPVRLTWLSSTFTLIGGGPVVLNGIVFSILSDLTVESYRSYVFLWFGAAVLATEVVFSSLAAFMLEKDVWLPIYVGMAFYVPVFAIAIGLPESLHKAACQDVVSESNHDPQEHLQRTGIYSRLSHEIQSFKTATLFFVSRNRFVVLLLSTLLTTTLGKHAQDIILQFARRRYGWEWSQAGYLLTLKACIAFLLLLVILPASGVALMRWTSYTAPQKDLFLARASCLIMLVGAAMIGLSFNSGIMISGIVVYCFGSGYNVIVRGLLASVVASTHSGVVFNAAGILESIGALVAGPLLAISFRVGLRLEGVWVGLPFMAAAGLFSIATVVLFTLRLPAP